MAIYEVQAPDGKTITLEGPSGATSEQIIAQAQALYKPTQPPTQNTQMGETGGGAAVGRPQGIDRTNIQPEPRPLESALIGVGKSAVIDPVLGAAQLASGGHIGGQTAQSYANQAKPYQEANPGSYLTGQIGGSVLPAAGILKGLGTSTLLKSPIANRLLEGVTGSALQGSLMPSESGKTGTDFYAEKAKELPTNAALGAVPVAIGQTGKLLGSLLRKGAGISTGAGEESLNQAFKAGKEGNASFVENMRGNNHMENVLEDAKSNLAVMRKKLGEEYRSGMVDIKSDKSVLDFSGIDNSIKEASKIGSFKGQNINPKAGGALEEIRQIVDEWKNLDPKEYHTPEGMDALKQKVGSVMESIPFESRQARTVAGGIYNSIKNEIATQAPVYSKVMKKYAEGSDLINEIKKSLSLGEKASTSTGLNKLQSLMRNNVNTNYGYRQELADKLVQEGGKELMPALAGQALRSWTPRGLVGQGIDAGALLGAVGSIGTGNMAHLPALGATVLSTSPRLMGEAAYAVGKATPNLSSNQKRLAELLLIKAAQEGNKP